MDFCDYIVVEDNPYDVEMIMDAMDALGKKYKTKVFESGELAWDYLEKLNSLDSQKVYPKFVLLDEPFAGVDPIAVEEIQTIVAKLKTKNIGILITDHNVRETLGICDHAYILDKGRVIAEGGRALRLM